MNKIRHLYYLGLNIQIKIVIDINVIFSTKYHVY